MQKTLKKFRFQKAQVMVMALVGALLILVGVLIIMNRPSQDTMPPAKQADPIPKVTSTEDLSEIEKTLDDTKIDDGADSSQLDSELSGF